MARRDRTSGAATAAAADAVDTRPTTEVLASLLVGAQALVAKEIELLGLELKGIVARKFTALGLLLAGALASAGVLLLGAMTAAFALEPVFAHRWQAWGVVTLGVLLVTLLVVAIALGQLARGWTPAATRRDVTTTATWLRELGTELVSSDSDDSDGGDDAGSTSDASSRPSRKDGGR
jgi:hypothetical protein